MLTRSFRLASLAILLALLNVADARGHAASNWYVRIQDQRAVAFYRDIDDTWTTANNEAIDVAAEVITDISGTDGYVMTRYSALDNFDGCFSTGQIPNIVSKDTVGDPTDLGPFVPAETTRCVTSGEIRGWNVVMNSEDYDFYWGPGDSYNHVSFRHARGILVHEFLHAAGFDPHWDEGGEAQLCDDANDLLNYHTGCTSGPLNTGTSPPRVEYERFVTLENHDEQTFVNAYP